MATAAETEGGVCTEVCHTHTLTCLVPPFFPPAALEMKEPLETCVFLFDV